MTPFDYMLPQTLDEACSAWRTHAADARLLAGGTDLNVALRHGAISTQMVIDLKAVAELAPDLRQVGGALRVSAGTTMTKLSRYLTEHSLFPSLREAADVVGSIQIRNRATLVGNICNASPAADTVPVLAALGALAEIAGPSGVRRTPVAEFIEGNRQIDLGVGEIVAAVHIPLPNGAQGCAFDRITRRRGVDLATVNMACTVAEDGQVTLAFGAVSPRPLVLHDQSGVLADPAAPAEARANAIESLADHARPISDVRANADYRRAMLSVMAGRALDAAHQRLAAEVA
ncbi:MAG: FAD binding domain-containing protein [Pseudomonadota bacterium]